MNYVTTVSFLLHNSRLLLCSCMNLTYRPEIQDIKLKKGLALQDILTELHLFVNKSMWIIYELKCGRVLGNVE